jgi:hypothetical protein
MKDPLQPVLFDLKARQLDWRLSAHLLHFNDGLMVTHFTRTTINPFQVTTWHIDEIPAAVLTDHGRLACFKAALADVANSQEVHDELAPRGGWHRASARKPADKVDQPSPFPSWWVE